MYLETYTNEKIRDLRRMRKLRIEDVAEATGISKSALDNYEKNEDKDISHRSIIALAKFYGVTTDYLLGLTENRNEQLTPIEELRLDDETIEILKNKKMNTRLLCELIKHPNFPKLMADMEIYVDGVAAMQIMNLNSLVDNTREEIIKRHNPEASDMGIQILEAAHIDADEYFASRIYQDVKNIIPDIKENHKHDPASGATTPAINDIKNNLEEAKNYDGNYMEKQLFFLCKQLGLNISTLSPEEVQVLMKALSKSSLLKAPVKQRGKKRKL